MADRKKKRLWLRRSLDAVIKPVDPDVPTIADRPVRQSMQ